MRVLPFIAMIVAGCGSEITIRTPGRDRPVPDGDLNPDNSPPVAVCQAQPSQVAPLSTADLVGENSYDPDENPIISYAWDLVLKPYGSKARLPNGAANLPTFVPDLAGAYAATLTVVDRLGKTSQPCAAELDVVPEHGLYVELIWQYEQDDLDLHLIRDDGSPDAGDDCSVDGCDLDWGTQGDPSDDPEILADDIGGTGPELAGIRTPKAGSYVIGTYDKPESLRSANNEATAFIWLNGVLVHTTKKVIRNEGSRVMFAKITLPEGTVTDL